MQMDAEIEANGPSVFAPVPGFWFDLLERSVLVLFCLWLIYNVIGTIATQPWNLMLLVSECLIAAFVLFRRPGLTVSDPRAWLVAAVGSFAPLLVVPDGVMLTPVFISASMMSTGITLSMAAKLTLRRSFGIVAANRGVQVVGPYGLVRHPMYLGYLATHVGFVLLQCSIWNVAVYSICWVAMVFRIGAEESVLRLDPEYRAYSERVRFRLIPGLW
jgi:protein-S-isoprenylcysteine O-methyltransferase Ste14